MESIMDVLAIPQNDDDTAAANNPYLGDTQPYKPDDTDPQDYDDSQQDDMLVMNNEFQPVPAPPGNGEGNNDENGNGGDGGGDDGADNDQTEQMNGGDDGDGSAGGGNTDAVAISTQQSELAGANGSGSATDSANNTNGNHKQRSNSRRRHRTRSRSRNGKKRSRSRSRSHSPNPRRRRGGGGRRSRSPRRRGGGGGGGGGGRRSSPQHRSSIKHDKDNLKYRWDRTIFVSNIPYEVKWAELKDLFREKVGDSAVVYCEIYERQNDGKSLGVGTIEFRTVADAERAVEVMHSYEMDGRKLSVRMDNEGFKARQARDMAGPSNSSSNRRNDSPERRSNGSSYRNSSSSGSGSSSSSMSNNGGILGMLGLGGSALGLGNSNLNNTAWLNTLAAQNGIEGPVTKRIFVASLDYKVDEHKLREVFGMAGRVRSVSLFRDRDNKSRGMALVEYDQAFDALNAIAMFNKQMLLDREMNVRFDTKPPTKEEEEQSRSSGSSKLPSGLRSIGSGISGISSILAAAAPPATNALGALGLSSMNPLGIGQPVSAAASNALTLGALTALAGLNSGGLGGAAGVGSNPLSSSGLNSSSLSSGGMGSGGSSGMNSGSGMDRDGMGNGYGMSSSTSMLNSFMDAVSARNSVMNGSNNNNMSNGGGGQKMQEQKTRITKIFIKNLPFSWDERRLKEKFSQAGRIEYAEIKKKDGKSRGFGMVRYSYPDQADKAVELFNGSNFDGRTLEVKLDLM